MSKNNNIPYSSELMQLKYNLNEVNDMGINFVFDNKSYKTLNFTCVYVFFPWK